MPEAVVAKRSRAEKNAARRKRKRDAAAAAAAAAAPATHDPAGVPAPQAASGSSTADRASRREGKHGVTTKKQRLAVSFDATGSTAPTAAAGAARGEIVPDGHRMQHAHVTGLQRSSGAAAAAAAVAAAGGGEHQGYSSADGREGGSRAAATGAGRGEGEVAAPGATAPSACKAGSNGKNISSGDNEQKRKKKKNNNKRSKNKAKGPLESLPPPSAPLPTPRTPREPTSVASSPSECRSRQGSTAVARGGDSNGSGGTRKDEEARSLSKALESARKKHRQEIGSGRPLVGWDVAAYAGFVFGELAAAMCSGQGEEEEEDGGAVAGAVDAVSAAAEEEHAGQVSMSQFEGLVRKEAAGFSARRRAASLLRRALEEEQEGNLDAAEAGCAACLAAWPRCASGHLKMAKILRARGVSHQRAIKDVEFHLRQALGSASKPGGGDQGEEVAQAAAERLSLLLCQEGRNKEAAKVLKRHGFRYRLSADVLRYPLPPQAKPPAAVEESGNGHNLARKPSPEARKDSKAEAGRRSDGKGGSGGDDASEFVAAVDGALPPGMLRHLQEAFGSRSRFWSEHGYNSETGSPGYFSYIHRLGGAPTTSIEQVINRVRLLAERSFPEVKEAKFVEWWAHRRPHSSGHQMHFDSDNEGLGGVRNPIVSVVVYVTGDVGGPTLVTTQRLTSKRLADRGWIVHPRVNRVCMFDGGVLHGVIPGRGVPVTETPPHPTPRPEEDGQEVGCEKVKEDRAGMRVTWMVAFWRDIQARPPPSQQSPPPTATTPAEEKTTSTRGEAATRRRQPPPSGAGAAQPFPAMLPLASGNPNGGRRRSSAAVAGPSWPALFRKKPEGWGEDTAGVDGGGGAREVPVVPVAVPQVWEDVDPAGNKRAGVGVRRLKRLPEYDLCFQGF
ncbi:unnamed protein product [Ectocarpus sp. 6 AP-2014]